MTRHQYGILRSFLRRHFAGKPVVASPLTSGNALTFDARIMAERLYVRHQYGILRSFLRRHFAGKPVVASPLTSGNAMTFDARIMAERLYVRVTEIKVR